MPLSLGIASGAGFLKNPAEPRVLGYRVNYISNPSFEVDTTGWSAVAGATLARSTISKLFYSYFAICRAKLGYYSD